MTSSATSSAQTASAQRLLAWTRTRRGELFLLAFVLLACLLLSRPAFEGYFSDDDLENLSLGRYVWRQELLQWLVSPRLHLDNYRPVGALYYRWLGNAFGLNFTALVLTLQLLHAANVALLWTFLRRTGLPALAAALACLFWGLHGVTFVAFWKPMYVFDVLVTLFALATLVLWQRGRWLLALLTFWLAFKSKELAITLPAVLLLYEWTLGQRRWQPLVPFFLISLSFGLQSLFRPPQQHNDYTMHFTLAALTTCAALYASNMLLVPYGGLAALALPWVYRHRAVWWGVAATWLLLAPMLFLPGRLIPVYLYLPLIGMATALGYLAWRFPRPAVALFLLWIPLNYWQLRRNRVWVLELGHQHRPYVDQMAAAIGARAKAGMQAAVWDGTAPTMAHFGTLALFRYASGQPQLPIAYYDSPEGRALLRQPGTVLYTYAARAGQLTHASLAERDPRLSLLPLATAQAALHLEGEGWYATEIGCRWTQGRADARVWQPAGASTLRLTLNIGHDQPERGQVVHVLVDSQEVGTITLANAGQRKEWSWPMTVPAGREVLLSLVTTPTFKADNGDPRTFGVMACEFGFVPSAASGH